MLEEHAGRALQDGHGAHAVSRLNALVDVKPEFQRLGRLGQRDVRFVLGQQQKALAVSDDALRSLAEGEQGSEAQEAFVAAAQAVFEKWPAIGPAARRFLLGWPPFVWFARTVVEIVRASVSEDHPAAQALAEATGGMGDEERAAFQLDGFEPAPARRPPGWLMSG